MSAANKVEFSCVFLVVLLWTQIQPGVAGTPPDEAVEIEDVASGKSIFNCPVISKSTRKVRFHEFKTQSGLMFRRKQVSESFLACWDEHVSPQVLTATNFLTCAQATEDSELEMFRYDGGVCTGYSNGISQEMQGCVGSGTVVLYTVLDAAGGDLSVDIRTDDATSTSISTTWTPQGDGASSCYIASYRVTFNGVESTTSSPSASFDSLDWCTDYNLTVAMLNERGDPVGTEMETTVTTLVDFGWGATLNMGLEYIGLTDLEKIDPCGVVDHIDFQIFDADGNKLNDDGVPFVYNRSVCLAKTFYFGYVLKNGTTIPIDDVPVDFAFYADFGWVSQKRGAYKDWPSQNACAFVTTEVEPVQLCSWYCSAIRGEMYGNGFTEDLSEFATGNLWIDLENKSGAWTWGNGAIEANDSMNWQNEFLFGDCAVVVNGPKLDAVDCSGSTNKCFCVKFYGA